METWRRDKRSWREREGELRGGRSRKTTERGINRASHLSEGETRDATPG